MDRKSGFPRTGMRALTPFILRGEGVALLGLLLGGYTGIDGAADKRVSRCLHFGT